MKGMTSSKRRGPPSPRRGVPPPRLRELDGSGRFYTNEELAAGAASGRKERPAKDAESPAA